MAGPTMKKEEKNIHTHVRQKQKGSGFSPTLQVTKVKNYIVCKKYRNHSLLSLRVLVWHQTHVLSHVPSHLMPRAQGACPERKNACPDVLITIFDPRKVTFYLLVPLSRINVVVPVLNGCLRFLALLVERRTKVRVDPGLYLRVAVSSDDLHFGIPVPVWVQGRGRRGRQYTNRV